MRLNLFHNRIVAALATAGCLLFAPHTARAQTTELAAGDTVTPPPTLSDILDGDLVDSLVSPFDETFNGQTITGNVVSAVYQNGTSEDGVFGGANYDFYYQVNFTSGTSVITAINPASFLGLRASVGQIEDGDGAGSLFTAGTIPSAQGRRTIDGQGINFDFVGLAPGESSFTLIVRTDTASFSRSGSLGILGSGVAATVLTIAPLSVGTVAPEPGALALLALGSVAFIASRRR